MGVAKARVFVGWALAISLLPSPARGLQAPEELYQRAQMLDQSNQNLSEAIRLYNQIAIRAKKNRALAAQAEFRVGVLYERLGHKAEAVHAFKVVVTQFADQTEWVQRAQAKIAAVVAGHQEAVRSQEGPDGCPRAPAGQPRSRSRRSGPVLDHAAGQQSWPYAGGHNTLVAEVGWSGYMGEL